MVEIVRSRKLAYFPVRKVGNTSIRRLLRELAEGPDDYVSTWDVPMSPYIRFRARNCHRIAVVRDPVRRFLSAFSNRVGHHRDLDRSGLARLPLRLAGLPVDPDLETFCRHFGKYYVLNDSIRRHFRPQWRYLGSDPSYFHRLYRLEEVGDLVADLSRMAGRTLEMPRLQTGGAKLSFEDQTPEVRRLILRFTRADYKVFANLYSPPQP